MEAFSIQNIIQGNGLAISITGMAIVFSGLIIMSIFIRVLPDLLRLMDKKTEETVAPQKSEAPEAEAAAATTEALAAASVNEDEDKDIASLIGLILHLENEQLYQSNNQYITINRDGTRQSMWGRRTGQMRSTPHRRTHA